MNNSEIPNEAPPPYTSTPQQTNLKTPKNNNGLTTSARRSMEDEMRPLPKGWVRQYDATSQHQFFVDTKADPPRAIWHHPYDDEGYLATLSSEERERLQEEQKRHASADHDAYLEDQDVAGPSSRPHAATASQEVQHGEQKQSFGRKLKDKLTGTTHEEREQQRKIRDKQDAEAYAAHRALRQAMARAEQTGQPQFVSKDADGRDVYVEPPAYGGNFYGGRPMNYRGISPYGQGPYGNPNARYVRPQYAYAGRPYGYGYGGGLGLPLAGGLAGGLLLGGLLGGF